MNIKKFETTGTSYRVHFTNTVADVELNNLYGHLHRIFQQILNETVKGVPFHYQVRLVFHSSLLKYPITFSFMSPQRLITERILAEFQRVIRANCVDCA